MLKIIAMSQYPGLTVAVLHLITHGSGRTHIYLLQMDHHGHQSQDELCASSRISIFGQ